MAGVICYEVVITHKADRVLASDDREGIGHLRADQKIEELANLFSFMSHFHFGECRIKLQARWRVTLSLWVVFNIFNSFKNANPLLDFPPSFCTAGPPGEPRSDSPGRSPA